MTEQTFRSPGFFEREIDLTSRETVVEGVPGGIIGTAARGPAFVPVTIGDFSDFELKFGSLDPELFGPYAADAWLDNKTALTYIRVLGAGGNTTGAHISQTRHQGLRYCQCHTELPILRGLYPTLCTPIPVLW